MSCASATDTFLGLVPSSEMVGRFLVGPLHSGCNALFELTTVHPEIINNEDAFEPWRHVP